MENRASKAFIEWRLAEVEARLALGSLAERILGQQPVERMDLELQHIRKLQIRSRDCDIIMLCEQLNASKNITDDPPEEL